MSYHNLDRLVAQGWRIWVMGPAAREAFHRAGGIHILPPRNGHGLIAERADDGFVMALLSAGYWRRQDLDHQACWMDVDIGNAARQASREKG